MLNYRPENIILQALRPVLRSRLRSFDKALGLKIFFKAADGGSNRFSDGHGAAIFCKAPRVQAST